MRQILLFLPCVFGASVRGGSSAVRFVPDKEHKDAKELTPVIKLPKRGSDPKDPMCLANTGLKCGDGKHSCNDWVACSEETHTCTCHHWGCADSAGSCRPIKNQWYENDNRLMALAAGKPGSPHRFVTMKQRNASNASKASKLNASNVTVPSFQDGYPAEEHPEALWKFLIMNDNATFLIETKQDWLRSENRFLALPSAPWQDHLMLAPIQVKPEDALQASWRLVERPQSRAAFQHVSSGRFLCYDDNTDGLSTCASAHCKPNSVDFEVWPKLVGIPMTRSEMVKLPGADGSLPQPNVSKKEPVSKPETSVPWYLRKKSSSEKSPEKSPKVVSNNLASPVGGGPAVQKA